MKDAITNRITQLEQIKKDLEKDLYAVNTVILEMKNILNPPPEKKEERVAVNNQKTTN